jgi:hypothetical protein
MLVMNNMLRFFGDYNVKNLPAWEVLFIVYNELCKLLAHFLYGSGKSALCLAMHRADPLVFGGEIT